MLIGAHVSTAGGLSKAVERGVERACEAIQIFNQSPRMWRPTNYSEEDLAAFRTAIAGSGIGSVVIHAVYLINCASRERQMREQSLDRLAHPGACGSVTGSAPTASSFTPERARASRTEPR